MSLSAPEAEFELKDGSRLILYSNRVVHEGAAALEIVPLGRLASVRVAFERDPRKLKWAAVLLLAALVLAMLAGPLQGWIAAAAAKVAEGGRRESLDAVLFAAFSALGGLARMMPAAALVLAAIAAALVVFFWLGLTTFTLCFGAVERAYAVRGRSRQLVEFAETVAARLASRPD
ncbi:MAG: hypothetical protein HYS35_08090 [Betaproteobacteria bacterium]|nr:hypothetical protein [Betaproteobacteria bacterium]